MKKIRYILILFLISSVICTAYETTCETLPRYNDYRVCITKNTLLIVDNSNTNKSSELVINDKRINKIFDDAFKNLPLKKLILSLANEKISLTTKSFNGLPMLEYLEFKSGIITLGSNLFGSIDKIEYLGIIFDGNTQKLEGQIPELENTLRNLSIIESKLKIVNSRTFFGINSALVDLSLVRNDIETIEPMAFQVFFRDLKSLTLDRNQLTNLQAETFYGLNHLEVLNINFNKLPSITKGCFNNTLGHLKKLYIESNEIIDIEDDAFVDLNITTLSLKSNKLQYIGLRAFHGLNNLKRLILNNNNFTTFPQNIFKNIKSLQRLDLNENKISQIEPGTFEGSNLFSLNLTNNKLEFIEHHYFEGIKAHTVDLSNNFIHGIVQDSFKNTSIRRVIIQNSKLKKIYKKIWGLLETIIVL